LKSQIATSSPGWGGRKKNIKMSEERPVEIETKLAFQEKTIKNLNDVLCKQHQAHKRNKGISK